MTQIITYLKGKPLNLFKCIEPLLQLLSIKKEMSTILSLFKEEYDKPNLHNLLSLLYKKVGLGD